MAITWTTTIIHETVFGNKRVVTADLSIVTAGAVTATATGDAYLPSALGMRGFDIVMMSGFTLSTVQSGASQTLAESVTVGDTGFLATYNYTHENIVINNITWTGSSSEGPSTVATNQDLTNAKIRIMAIGFN